MIIIEEIIGKIKICANIENTNQPTNNVFDHAMEQGSSI